MSTLVSPPAVGLGLWKIDPAQVADMVEQAIKVGYRHLDSACDYGNEPQVGQGLQRALADGRCRREHLWITSKLWNTYHEPKHVRPALERTLRDLRVDYLDLYLIHFPIPLAYVPTEERYPPGWFFDPSRPEQGMKSINVPIADTWGALEQLVDAGLVRQIGVANFGVSLLRDLINGARIQPSVLQVELHPHLAQAKLLRFCQESKIAVTAFSPLGALSYVSIGMATASDSVLSEPTIVAIARQCQRTPAQVVLKWGVQRGTSVIPKTSRPERLAENLQSTDFVLTNEQMQQISALDRHRRFNDPGVFCEAAFKTYFPIFE